jgi:hypothetical protein
MDSDFCKKLAAALGVEPVPPPCPVQVLFNRYLKHLDSRVIHTRLPEKVYLRAENFPYWIKLENPNPANLSQWIPSKANVVVPMLKAGCFDQTGFRFDEIRAKALFNVPELLQMPNCIHKNLRKHSFRGQGGIKGDHMYVSYYGNKTRKVAFTIFDQTLNKVVLVSSFWTYRGWVEDCAHMPAVYVREERKCSCK